MLRVIKYLAKSLKVTRGYSSCYWGFIVTMARRCIISEIKRDIGRKSWLFHTRQHSTPPLEASPSKYWFDMYSVLSTQCAIQIVMYECMYVCMYKVWYGKTRMVWVPNSGKFRPRPTFDRRTDGKDRHRLRLTTAHYRPRCAYASRGNKIYVYLGLRLGLADLPLSLISS